MCHSRILRYSAVFAAIVLVACSTPESKDVADAGKDPIEVGTQADDPGETAQAVEPAEETENASDFLDSYSGTADAASALETLEKSGVQDMDEASKLVYAVLLRTENRLDESRTVLEQILADNPDDAGAWFNLALVEHAAGNAQKRDAATGFGTCGR